MTSDVTHGETVAFFEEQHYFGLDPRDVFFFQQGTMPAVDSPNGTTAAGRAGENLRPARTVMAGSCRRCRRRDF